MARVRHLRNAPITEAVVDFRVSLAKGFPPERLRRAADLLAREYPVIEQPQGFEAHVRFSGGEPKAAVTTRDLGTQGIWLRTEDKKNVAQFRVDGFTFNRLKPYTRWEQILPEALRLWEIYVGLANPQGITRLALRYINHLNLPRPGVELLDDYIVTAPPVPPSVPKLFSSFITRLALERPDGRMKANVTQALEVGVETSAHSLLFDIDVYRVGDVEINSAAITSALDDLRAYKNDIFFGSLTERFVEVFE